MMDKLLGYLGRVWNKMPKDFSTLSIQQGTGPYTLVTVGTQYLSFHSTPYRSDMPDKQSLYLDDYTLSDLVTSINGMGYNASLTQEAVNLGYGSLKSYTLMPVTNAPVLNATLTSFTSPLWQLLYPLARLLEELDNDTDSALAQMYTSSITGKWMEYWATFFKIKRLAGESDPQLRKRIFLSLMNMKTNNVALQELLKYSTNGSAVVADYAPAQFEVFIDPAYMGTVDTVRQIITDAKGAGIDYFLNYLGTEDEDYKAYFKDTHSITFAQSDTAGGSVDINLRELTYGGSKFAMFKVGKTKLSTDPLVGALKVLPKGIIDESTSYISGSYAEGTYPSPLDSAVVTAMQIIDSYPVPSDAREPTSTVIDESYIDPDASIKGLVGFRTNRSLIFSPTNPLSTARISVRDIRVLASSTLMILGSYSEPPRATPLEANTNAVLFSDTYPSTSEASDIHEVDIAERYIDPVVKGLWGFRTNYSRVFSPTDTLSVARLSILDTRVQEVLNMTLSVGGVAVKTM